MNNMNIYVYKMVADNGGAPCVSDGLLTLAICKPMIRKMAEVNSLVFGFGGKEYGEKLIYVAKVTEKLRDGDYYRQPKYARRRDCIYQEVHGKPEIKANARFHRDGDQLQHDAGLNFERAFVLLSREFRYFGKQGTTDYQNDFPQIAKLIEKMKRGHRVNYSPDVYAALEKLKAKVWGNFPRNFRGQPTDSDPSKICNSSSGSCRCEKPK
jgi:hypothetical protein